MCQQHDATFVLSIWMFVIPNTKVAACPGVSFGKAWAESFLACLRDDPRKPAVDLVFRLSRLCGKVAATRIMKAMSSGVTCRHPLCASCAVLELEESCVDACGTTDASSIFSSSDPEARAQLLSVYTTHGSHPVQQSQNAVQMPQTRLSRLR